MSNMYALQNWIGICFREGLICVTVDQNQKTLSSKGWISFSVSATQGSPFFLSTIVEVKLLLGFVWVFSAGDGGGVNLYPVCSGFWILVDVFLPWMIILPVGKTRGCCATSWRSALPSFSCHTLSSVTPFFPLPLLPATLLQSFAISEAVEVPWQHKETVFRWGGNSKRELICSAWRPLRIDLARRLW